MIEEALIEELLMSIANLANAEEHLIETAFRKKHEGDDKGVSESLELADATREIRQKISSMLFSRDNGDEDGGQFRSHSGETWCALKHHLISKIHILESIEKLQRAEKFDEAKALLDVMFSEEVVIRMLVKKLKSHSKKEVGKGGSS